MIKNVHITIVGKVQGVGFRWSSYEKFVELGLVGKAENGEQGAVEIVVNGEEAALQQFIEWCKQGPVGARVTNVEVKETVEPATYFGMEQKKRLDPVDKED